MSYGGTRAKSGPECVRKLFRLFRTIVNQRSVSSCFSTFIVAFVSRRFRNIVLFTTRDGRPVMKFRLRCSRHTRWHCYIRTTGRTARYVCSVLSVMTSVCLSLARANSRRSLRNTSSSYSAIHMIARAVRTCNTHTGRLFYFFDRPHIVHASLCITTPAVHAGATCFVFIFKPFLMLANSLRSAVIVSTWFFQIFFYAATEQSWAD